MAGTSNKFSTFWQELKRRKTDRVVVVYAAAAFTIIQLVPTLQSALFLPDWTTTVVVIILAIGFPLAAILSWFYDIVPGGIESTKTISDKSGTKIQTQLRTWKSATMISIIVIISLILFNVISSRIEATEIKRTEKTIAVIPFENLSPNEDLPITSDGITSIITTGLSKIDELTVCSRISVSECAAKNRSVFEIAKKLKVFFIVTGELVKGKSQILVNVNLIRVKKEKVIWAKNFDLGQNDDINIDKLIEIPIQIAKNLEMALTPEVKSRINKRPTKSTTAYLNYIEGTAVQDIATDAFSYLSKGDSLFNDLSSTQSFEKAISFYDKAIMEDSTFALAYAKRAITRAWGYNADHFTARDHIDKCREDIEHALRIDKNLTEAKVAYGFYYYYFLRDYDKALEYFREASIVDPKYWQCKYYMALVLRAHGEWEESQKLMMEVVKSNPLNALFLTNIGLSYDFLHKYDTAIYYHDRAIQIMPEWSASYQNKIESLILRDGNTRAAEIVLDTAEVKTRGGYFYIDRILLDLYNGRFDDALLKTTIGNPSDFFSQGERYMIFAEIYRYLKNPELSRNYYQSALDLFNRKLAENPENPRILSRIGIAAAGLNDRLKAIESGEKAIELSGSNVKYKMDGIQDLAQIYVLLGEDKKSLELLEELLKNPSTISLKLLQLDPVWKPLLDMPEFKKLISLYSKN
jgi:TolB-like protein/tetratricopeptide (TPR) repeat protein